MSFGGTRKADGVINFDTDEDMHRALGDLRNRFPWLRRGDPSHPVGDVATSCVAVSAGRAGRLAYANLPYFSMV